MKGHLIDYLAELKVSQGRRAGEPFKVLRWQGRFIRGPSRRAFSLRR